MREEIKERLEGEFPDSKIAIELDGNRAGVLVVSDEFEGLSRVKRQQRVYGCLNDYIQSGAIHAVSITAKTPDEAKS